MRLIKMVSFTGDHDDSFHIMKYGREVFVFHKQCVSVRRIDTDKTYSLENNLTGEHWSGLDDFISSPRNKAKVVKVANGFYTVEACWI